MDILSDVKIVGNLTTTGDLQVKRIYANDRIEMCNGITMGTSNDLVSNGRLSIPYSSYLYVKSGGNLVICAGANVKGLNLISKTEFIVPANCTKFQIDKSDGSFNFTKPAFIQAFMKDSNSNWNSVELDFQFEKCGSLKMYKPIATISSAFTEDKEMYFVFG